MSHKCLNNLERTSWFYDELNRLEQNCSNDVVRGEDGSASFSQFNEWTLAFIAITIRHGDRSPIHSLPGSIHKRVHFSDSSSVTLLDIDAAKFAKRYCMIKFFFVMVGCINSIFVQTIVVSTSTSR